MDYRGQGQRPPRSSRPPPAPPSYPNSPEPPSELPEVPFPSARPPIHPSQASTFSNQTKGTVSFQEQERGERHEHVGQRMQPVSAWGGDPEAGEERVGRKKSLVRPDREKLEPGHRLWHYRAHAAQLEQEHGGRVGVLPSSTGNAPQAGRPGVRRGKSILGREEDVHESGLALFKRGTNRRLKRQASTPADVPHPQPQAKGGFLFRDVPGPHDWWMLYCLILTICIPNFLLAACGIKTPEQQRAWREKMGLLSVVAVLMTAVGYLTFGFTETVCGRPPTRFHSGTIGTGSVIIHGYDYDLSKFNHPKTATVFPNGSTNPLFEGGWNVAGNDISFMFQKVNQHCLGIITKASNSSISGSNGNVDWYFPCNVYSQHGNSGVNLTGYDSSENCHITSTARNDLASLHPQGQVYYTWDDVKNPSRNLAVFESTVLDLNLLTWLSRSEVNYPKFFDELAKPNGTYNGKDLTMQLLRTNQRTMGHCLEDLVTVGFIDTNTIGCVASEVVLYVSLVFIIGVVGIRFGMAVIFTWFFSWKLGDFKRETYEQRMQRSAEIENWTNDIYRPAPSQYRPNVNNQGLTKKNGKRGFLPSTSRFTPQDSNVLKGGRPATAYGMIDNSPYKRSTLYAASARGTKLTPPETMRESRSSTSLNDSAVVARGFNENPCPFPLYNIVPQPPPDYEPFGYPLIHTICLVTAYSESVEGLRTTLDSLATTDYPNSHKVILVIADGLAKGAGNDMTTPDICLTMMKDFLIPPEEVEPHSYVAIADGHKRHNMAQVYAGFYAYDDATVEMSKQQRVPMVLVAKCGNPLEANDPKPGNRGKRDSQIMLMSFMQKVMFDERMTTFEYEFFNSMWRVTGISPDRYETVLCVDADTKVFPDSLSRMVACMVQDVEIMGLCGETKIANKAETWVTMIQVFEYYNSHHNVKAFESMFGGVTCLPGCFSMYRIKAPKGDSGYWVPILANPDIVEHYSENVVDSLHKKNLLLLGEDRYLTTLLLKTFPRRKNVFCPQAVCKTIVPDTFRVLLSQRRRWINSTVHNLFELILVRDLCGTFCFSMQFVTGMELAGMLVLPAAISFTLYLIIVSIIPGGTNTTIPLVLLAIVLGLPGVLIVITSRKLAYVGWMIIYLFSLPVWNGILPMYAFWHFDDFSWGQTRQVAGDKKGADHGDKEGEFDSSHIVMKRWAEFERERRWKTGTTSRDSTFWDVHSGSPKRPDSNRYSMVSSTETYQPSPPTETSTTESGAPITSRGRYEKDQLLMLPAPLSVARPVASSTVSGSSSAGRTSEEGWPIHPASSSNQRLVPSPDNRDPYDDLDSVPPAPVPRHAPASNPFEHFSRTTGGSNPPHRSMTSPISHSAEIQNSYRDARGQAAAYNDSYTTEPDMYVSQAPAASPSSRNRTSSQDRTRPQRGVSLADNGPVPTTNEGVRRVARQSRRPSSQTAQNRYSRSSPAPAQSPPPGGYSSQPNYQLPPGAAPPREFNGQGYVGYKGSGGYIDN